MTTSELNQLQAQNQALADELAQCQADKEFVWSLWKRLQVANPDVTQAISLVVQREKEKAELKDRKVLEILQIKDDRIADLERLLSQQQEELQGFISRKIEVEDEKKDVKKENRLLREKQQQLEQLVESKEVRLMSVEDVNKEAVEKLEAEKQECVSQVTSLTLDLEKAKQTMIRLQASNMDYQNKIKDLDRDVQVIQETAQEAADKEDATVKKLTDLRENLRKCTAELRSRNRELAEQEKELVKTRKELSDLRTSNGQASEHAKQQADVIQQLQALQFDTQKVLKNQEAAHKLETASFQTMYQELQAHYKANKTSERVLKERLVQAEAQLSHRKATRTSSTQMYQELQAHYKANKTSERVLKERLVQAEAQLSHRKATRTSSTQVNLMTDEAPAVGKQDNDMRRDQVSERYQHARDDLDDRYKSLSSSHIKGSTRRSRSLSPRRPHSYPLDAPSTGTDQPDAVSSSDAESRESDGTDRRLADLRKLLRLKNAELEEMRTAHTRRLERLKALQASHNILREQIKTYDAEERNPPKKKKKSRPSEPRTLQKEDSDTVWNELAYFKQQTVNVLQERMNLHEELDCLRVQTAADATTIKELTTCLQQERQELEEQLNQLREVSRREKAERDQSQELKEKMNHLEELVQKLSKEKNGLIRNKSRLETENRSLRMSVSKQRAAEAQQESKMMDLKKAVNQLKKRLRHLKHRQRHTVAGVALRRGKTAKEHQAILNRSIQEMSAIFPVFDSDDWEEMDHSSSPRESTSMESLGQHIVETSRSHDNVHTPRRGIRSGCWGSLSPSARQLASIQKHLHRMAQAYEENPVRDVILKTVATQTERVLQASMIDAGVGEYLISDDTCGSTTPNNVTSSSTMTDTTLTEPSDTELRDVGTSPHVPLTRLVHSVQRRSHGQGTSGPTLASLKQRVASLQQQVSLLKESKSSLQRTVTQQQDLSKQLQSDLNLTNQRLKMSRQTVQRLTGELEESSQQRALFQKQLSEGESESKRQFEMDRKQMDTRLKAQSVEVARQAGTIKSLRLDLESRDETIRTLQEKVGRQDRDINQKRSLIEDLKVRVKSIDSGNKVATRATELLEEKISTLTEGNEKRKVEVESLRKQLTTVSKEKRHNEQLYMKCQMELDRKVKLLQEAHIKLAEAETVSTELEVTAGQQLKQLARQTELALETVQAKLKRTQAQNKELQTFVKALASNLLSLTQDARQRLRPIHRPPEHSRDSLNGSMSRAQGIASSILNMSASDLDDFMASSGEDGDVDKNQEETAQGEDHQWSIQLGSALSSKAVSGEKLLDLFLVKMQEKDDILVQVEKMRR